MSSKTPATDASSNKDAIPVLTAIAPLAHSTTAWLVDIWGVMHNGVTPFAEAVAACERFRSSGGLVLLLSNSPRPAAGVTAQLDQIGVARSAYDGIVSSGDATRRLIAEWGARAVFHLGPERDRPLFDGLPVRIVNADQAEGVVCSGLFDDSTETPDDYREILTGLRGRDLPMICANPDLRVERGGQIIYCAGAIAAAYADIGGKVTYAGKPYLPVYEMAFAELQTLSGTALDRGLVLAIGDGVKTDIAGAASAGIRSVYIASAIHMGDDQALDASTLSRLFPEPAGRPVAAMAQLSW